MVKCLVVIPARYESSRFPGKPLAKIAGKEMLLRVYENSKKAAEKFSDIDVVVATDHEKIENFCKEKNIKCVMTSKNCKTGSERALEAADNVGTKPEFVVNVQGDNPLCPPWVIEAIIQAYYDNNKVEVVTPCVNLTWEQLDTLRKNKETTPFSGTTAVLGKDNYAIWFSKNIIPSMRKEESLRIILDKSPVHQHIGLYGYNVETLRACAQLPESYYESYEFLEQLRFLENGYKIKLVVVDYRGYSSTSGVDSPEDIGRAEALLEKQGEFK